MPIDILPVPLNVGHMYNKALPIMIQILNLIT